MAASGLYCVDRQTERPTEKAIILPRYSVLPGRTESSRPGICRRIFLPINTSNSVRPTDRSMPHRDWQKPALPALRDLGHVRGRS